MTRLAGSNRYETSVQIAQEPSSLIPPVAVAYVATGADFPDALTELAPDRIVILGGISSVSDAARDQLLSIYHDTTPPSPVTGLSATSPNSTSLTLSWTNPGDSDFTGVMIRRSAGPIPPATPSDGTLVTYASGASYTDSYLTPASIDPHGLPQSVSCPSSEFCAAVDNDGNVLIGRG